jgi:salicylate hydroxylase
MTDRDVLIAGGGIGGVTAALCLAREGFNVRVFEQAPEFGEVGAGIQLAPNCTRVLHALGLEEALRSVAFLPEGVDMRAWNSGKLLSYSPLGKQVADTYGFPYYHLHRADIMQVLVDAASAHPNVELLADARVEHIERRDDGVTLQAGGRTYDGALLVGADGIHSVVRAELFGPEAPTFTGTVAWRGLVPADRLPRGLVRPVATAWWGPHKHFVHYYVRRGELVNCVCVVEKEGWEVESWSARGDRAELKQDFTGWHETIQVLIDNMDADACFKWALFDRPPMRQWSDGRVTLLGDACHPTLPFMAQGAAMAIEDGAVLAGCVAKHNDIAASLKHYESLRRERTAGVQDGSRRNAKVFHMSGIKAWLRNHALGERPSAIMERLYRYNALDVVR